MHTLLEIQLITGKTHQIRAHLASDNHPIIGDYKYGNKKINDKYKEAHGVSDQLLHAYRMEFPSMESPFDSISNKKIICEMPDLMLNLLQREV
jgi:23S rRNA pseudouridine955/2504/2580 synthase